MVSRRWNIGVTHLIKPPFDPELAAFGDKATVHFFDTRNEADLDPALLKQLDSMLVWTPSISALTASRLTQCKILVRYGVGYDKIDRAALAMHNIAFSNNPEYGPEDVADTAMALLLTLQRKIVEHDFRSRHYTDTWQENYLPPVVHSRDSTVGVVGLGRIGTSLVNRLKPFGYRILGYDPYVSNGMCRAIGVERVENLSELLAQVDALSLHCPLTERTSGMINSRLLNGAKPGLLLVNTARGALIDTLDTVYSALKSGKLAAAGLDVLPDEPPQSHPLIDAWRAGEDWLCGRLLINPHNAFYSDASLYECRYQAAETARLFLEDGIHRNAVPVSGDSP